MKKENRRVLLLSLILGFTVIGGLAASEFWTKDANSSVSNQEVMKLEVAMEPVIAIDPLTYLKIVIQEMQPRLDPIIIQQIAESVSKYSKKYGFPPEFVLAVMNRESKLRPTLVSTANCKGLMQVNPPKHLEKLKALGLKENSPGIFYIDNNIKIGCQILREYYDSQNGDVSKALTRYVGGSHPSYVSDVMDKFTDLVLKKYNEPYLMSKEELIIDKPEALQEKKS